MRKFPKIKSIIDLDISNEAKAKQIENLINRAVSIVVADVFEDTKSKGLFTDAKAAESIKDSHLGQATMPDYPDL
ncbi:MAG: hypothetical protein A4S09_14090 [Proteobacteria bacterium SG_bin7]|nr:MAG: hypothetical protein A4S09_14090 [Proteobacteria bacterium SG_bin7]